MIKLLAHRGLWVEKSEQNTLESFQKSLDEGVGLETDFRDLNGKLVISHNPATQASPLADDIFQALSAHPNFHKVVYAMNIKSDGIQKMMRELIEKYDLQDNGFVFDMSVPSHLGFVKAGFLPKNIGTRISDIEPDPLLLDESEYMWVDQFNRFIFEPEQLKKYQKQGKILCFVSTELHKRDHNELWEWIEVNFKQNKKDIFLCTDLVKEAKNRFNTTGFNVNQ